MRLGISHQTD